MSDHLFDFENEAAFVQDREDLLTILKMRFGDVPAEVTEKIYALDRMDALERLILVAANAPDFNVFLEELEEGQDSFKILGERFNPLAHEPESGEMNGE